jgi:hypothetical protein
MVVGQKSNHKVDAYLIPIFKDILYQQQVFYRFSILLNNATGNFVETIQLMQLKFLSIPVMM